MKTVDRDVSIGLYVLEQNVLDATDIANRFEISQRAAHRTIHRLLRAPDKDEIASKSHDAVRACLLARMPPKRVIAKKVTRKVRS